MNSRRLNSIIGFVEFDVTFPDSTEFCLLPAKNFQIYLRFSHFLSFCSVRRNCMSIFVLVLGASGSVLNSLNFNDLQLHVG